MVWNWKETCSFTIFTFPTIILALMFSPWIPLGYAVLLNLQIVKTRNLSKITWLKSQPAVKNTYWWGQCFILWAGFIGYMNSDSDSGKHWTAESRVFCTVLSLEKYHGRFWDLSHQQPFLTLFALFYFPLTRLK